MLGHFILPVSRLEEFDDSHAALGPSAVGDVWRLSVLPVPTSTRARGHCRLQPQRAPDAAVVDTVELKLDALPDLASALAGIPPTLTT